jgi:putative acetyltransferase
MQQSHAHHDDSIKRSEGLIIHAETEADTEAIDHVVESAYRSPAVAWMVRQIRESPHYIPELSLVADKGGEIVGYAMLSYVELADGPNVHQVITLSPLAVVPEAQSRGVGTSLVQAVLQLAEHRGEPLVTLEGDPGYYGRFGFEDSRKFGIHFSDGGLIYPLSHYNPSLRGDIRYTPVFAEMQRRRLREKGHLSHKPQS